MAQQKQSARQLTDAAAAAHAAPVVDEFSRESKPTRKAHTKPENFKGDRPGFFRGARIRG